MMKASTFLPIPLIFTSIPNQFKAGKFIKFVLIMISRPKLQLNVWRLDQWDKLDIIAYGIVNLPNETGAFDLECPTWRPMTGYREEAYNFYLGGPPKLKNTDPVIKDLDQRKKLTSMSSGTITLHCEVLMKGFKDNSISGSV